MYFIVTFHWQFVLTFMVLFYNCMSEFWMYMLFGFITERLETKQASVDRECPTCLQRHLSN